MSENKKIASFGGSKKDQAGLGNPFEALRGFQATTHPEAGESSVGAQDARRKPTVAKKIEKKAVEVKKPIASDLFAGYAGKGNVEKYAGQIAWLMKGGTPSLEEIKKILPKGAAGVNILSIVQTNYPEWSRKFEGTVFVAADGETKTKGDKTKSISERISGYLDNYEKHFIRSGNLRNVRNDFLELLENRTDIRRENLSPEERNLVDKKLQEAIDRRIKEMGEGRRDDLAREGVRAGFEMTRDGALKSIESQKNGIIGAIQGWEQLIFRTENDLYRLLEKLSIHIPSRQEKEFERMNIADKNAILEAMDEANQVIKNALRERASRGLEPKETSEEKEAREKREQADKEMIRTVAEYTLHKISSYEELWAKDEKAGNEKFAKKTQELWKEFAVHGMLSADKDGKPTLIQDTDLDGKVSLGFLKAAGLNVTDLKYVHPGDFEEGRLNIDSGKKHGVALEIGDDGKLTLFFDHHEEGSGNDTSSAEITYKIMVGLGLLKREPLLDKVVKFTNQVDNWTFPQQELFFDRSNQTVLGLYRWIKFDKLTEFAKGKKKFTDLLSSQELKDLELEDRSRRQGYTIENAKKKFDSLEKNGQVFHSSKYGRVVVSINKELRGRYDAARYFGCDTFVEWNPETQGFAIYSAKNIEDDFGEGVKVRDKMWMRPPKEGQPLGTSLGEILRKIGGDDFQPIGELAEYLKAESKKIENKKRIDDFKSDYEVEKERLDELFPEPTESPKPSLEPMEDAVRRRQKLNAEAIERADKEDLLFELYQEFAQKFWDLFQKMAMAEFEKWGYNARDRRQMMERQTRAYLERNMEEKGDFLKNRREKIDQIMEIFSIDA